MEKGPTAAASELALKRKLLFTPLESKEALRDWIHVFLGLQIPDCTVDETSNSSPMDCIWEVYDKCRKNDDEDYNRVLSYASRMSFKTLGASILEVLMVLHLRRSVAHMAAIEPQAKKSQEYVKKFLRQPILRDFVVGNNQRRVDVVRYEHRTTKENLTPKQWEALASDVERDQYEQVSHYIVIVICTMQGANSEHVPFMVIDEVDVVANPAAYREAMAIPDVYEGKMPVTLLTSTRKSASGLVQKEIDRADEQGLHIRHWNIIDVTERCPPSRHKPELPKIPIYRSDDTLRALSERDYKELPPDQQKLYVKDEGWQGCLSPCKLFAVCKGRLATHQMSTSNLLKKIAQTQNQFKQFSPDMAKAQLLCWKPSTEGLIYPRLDPTVHLLTAAQIAQKVTGELYNPKMTKSELVALLQTRDVQWYGGMDFGFTHNFAVVVGVRDGARMFVLDVLSQAELDLGQMIQACDLQIRKYEPTIFADPEDPGRIKTLRKAGYRMREAPKPKGSVVGGIEVVRLKLWPAIGEPELFFLAEDEGVALLFRRLQGYAWTRDAADRITNIPNDEEDDECDALRYMVMNVFAPKGKVSVARPEERNPLAAMPDGRQAPEAEELRRVRWAQMMQHAGMAVEPADAPTGAPGEVRGSTRGKKGNFVWNLG